MRWPHTISFESKERVSDGGGGFTETWVNSFQTEAHVQPITGNQRFKAQQLETPVNHKIYIPAQDGVKPSMRVKWHDRTNGEGDPLIITLKSDPIDQGGLGRIYMLEGVT